ncbi:hypothetical protein KM043_001599 [Ampulex compressa]|nr:hypothetical protein KM043_001599 [Ampulex compressa]
MEVAGPLGVKRMPVSSSTRITLEGSFGKGALRSDDFSTMRIVESEHSYFGGSRRNRETHVLGSIFEGLEKDRAKGDAGFGGTLALARKALGRMPEVS